MTPEQDYARLVAASLEDPSVVGLVLTGSRGRKAFVRPESDWDVRLIVRDGSHDETESKYDTPRGSPVEVSVLSLTGFEQAGALGSPNEWARYSYAHAEVVLDKLDGRITDLVAEKSVLPPEAAMQIAEAAIDTYINSYYRSAKNLRDGLLIEAHLDAAESISPFLSALFAFHERVRPFNKFLHWELDNFPLGDDLWRAAKLLPRLETITASGEIGEQRSLFCDVESLARRHGLARVIDSWEPDVSWLRSGRSNTKA